MTNAEIIATIRNEIERRLKNTRDYMNGAGMKYKGPKYHASRGRESAYDAILSFLSTLESEKPMNQDELMKEVQRYYSDNFDYISSDQPTLSILTNIARHFAKWGAEHLADARKTSPKDLEEAAGEYEKKHTYQRYDGGGLTPEYNATLAEAVIFGAKWQKQHDAELIEIAYNDGITIGMTKQKEQMMKEAIEGKIVSRNDGWNSIELPSTFFGELSKNYNHGDKVRVIVLPKKDRL